MEITHDNQQRIKALIEGIEEEVKIAEDEMELYIRRRLSNIRKLALEINYYMREE